MGLPSTAKPFEQPLDPTDQLDYYVFINQGEIDAKVPPLLRPGEAVASYTLALLPEAVLMGVNIVPDGGRGPTLVGNLLTTWFDVDEDKRDSPAFDTKFVAGLVLTAVTTAVPSRRFQRTYLLEVLNQ